MKKYIVLLFASLTFAFAGCEKETEPGGTAVEKMAGEWWITVDAVDNNGTVIAEDPYGIGRIRLNTYNTASDTEEMWIDDLANFWDYKVKVDVDYAARTFSTVDFVDNTSYESKVKVTNGKVLEGAGKSRSGLPVDSIVYIVQFDDDDPENIYKVSGSRRTGFPDDEY